MVAQKRKPVKRVATTYPLQSTRNKRPSYKFPVSRPANRQRARPTYAAREPTNASERLLARYPYQPPARDDENAEFNQYFMSQNQRAVVVYQCAKCNTLAQEWDEDFKWKGRSCLILPVCPSCILTNRRVSQAIFFNIAVKNAHDRIVEADRAKPGPGEAEVSDDEMMIDENDEGGAEEGEEWEEIEEMNSVKGDED